MPQRRHVDYEALKVDYVRGLSFYAMAQKHRTSVPTIRKLANQFGWRRGKIPVELKPLPGWYRQALSMSLSGVPHIEIAQQFGVTKQAVANALRRSAAAEALVPGWVPAALHTRYRRITADTGEQDAASWARKEKRLMEGMRA